MIRFPRAIVGIAALVCLRPSFADACPPLPPGLRANVRAINLHDPIPANGAIVFRLSCWHDCTVCQAAEQAIHVDLRDASGGSVPGDKPVQIFLSDRPNEHLVVWRPLEPLQTGAHYTVQASVIGQDDPATSDEFDVSAAMSALPLETMFSARSTSYREERGTLFHCDTSKNDCDISSASFGDQYAMLPALEIFVGARLAGQIIYRVRDETVAHDPAWESWSSGGERTGALLRYREAHDPYCAEVEARSLVDADRHAVFSTCAPHGDLDAPSVHTTAMAYIDSQLFQCQDPPADLQERWCMQRRSSCTTSCCPAGCLNVNDYCSAKPRQGWRSSTWVEPGPASHTGDQLCPRARDPYALVAGGGCQAGRGPAPIAGITIVWMGLFGCLRRRRPIGRRRVGRQLDPSGSYLS